MKNYARQFTFFILISLLFSSFCKNSFSQCSCNLPLCNGSIVNETYSSSAGWTDLSSGTMAINPVMYYNGMGGGSVYRMYRNIPTTTSSFYAECSVAILNSNNPNAYIFTLSKNNFEPIDQANPFERNAAVFVFLYSPYQSVCGFGQCPWYFRMGYNDGVNSSVYSSLISVPAINTTYYIRLVKHETGFQLNVAYDPAFVNPLPGSPICWNPNICLPPFYVLQHGKAFTTPTRTVNLKVDNLKICPYPNGACNFPFSQCRLVSENSDKNEPALNIVPNINGSNFLVQVKNLNAYVNCARIIDLSGRIVKSIPLNSYIDNYEFELDVSDLSNGIYFAEIVGKTESWKSKILVTK